MMMDNTESKDTSKLKTPKQSFLDGNIPLITGALVLILGGGLVGYTVGHRQGLSVTGYSADAEQLAEVTKVQKERLDIQSKTLNTAMQERDVAVTNSNDLFESLQQVKVDLQQAEGMANIYRSILKQRGGLSLTVQNLGIKPLPENAYEYQIDLVQVSPNNQNASGNVELRLIRGAEVLTVPLEKSQFNFENFERLTGRWTMPKGFVPQFIEVRISGSTPIAKRFNWAKGAAVEAPSAFISEIPQVKPNAQ
jgi:hypothetical protein